MAARRGRTFPFSVNSLDGLTPSTGGLDTKQENRASSNRSAARLLAYALEADDAQTWLLVSAGWEHLLDRTQLAPLAFASLAALAPDDAEEVVTAALGEDAGPLPTFISEMDDARFWAGLASRRMLKAYALASFEAMHPHDQAAFLDHVTERRAAA